MGIYYSIVIPAYNAAPYIMNTLDSVRLQTYSDYEVIVVNDGSHDNTLKIVEDYFNKYPFLKHKIINQPNKGIGAARNSGIREARGEFVAFLDADDKWYKDKLERIRQFIGENPDIDFVCHDDLLIQKGKVVKTYVYGPYTTYEELLFKRNCISTSSTVVRTSKLREVGLFSESRLFNGIEDYELWLRLFKVCKVGYLHKVLGEYYLNDSGISSNLENAVRNSLNVLNAHFKAYRSPSVMMLLMMVKRKLRAIAGAVYQCVKKKNIKMACRVLWIGFKTI